MPSRSLLVLISSRSAASMLLAIGCVGLVQPRQAIGLDGGSTLNLVSDAAPLASHLRERELVLDQRREAESLLQDFTRAQMTRHYWGEFASSLQQLGLMASETVTASVERDDVRSRLWLVPRRGTEAYLAVVERRESRLFTLQCKGSREQALKTYSGDCPPTWTALDHKNEKS